MHRRIASAAAALAIVASVVLAPSAAMAADPPVNPLPGPLGTAYNLFDFMLSVKSQQLMSMQGPAAVGAWSAQNARLAAQSANTFRSGVLYGNIAAEQIAEVVPLYDPIDVGYGLGRKITPGPGTPGFRVPAFSAAKLVKGAGAAGTVLMGYSIGSMVGAGAVNQWGGFFGIDDANGKVCSEVARDGGGFVGGLIGFASGQNCGAFLASAEFAEQRNADAVAGVTFGPSCNSAGVCIQWRSEYYSGTNKYACFSSGGVGARWWIKMTADYTDGPNSGFLASSTGSAPTDCANVGLGSTSVDWHIERYQVEEPGGGWGPEVEGTIGTADPDRTLRCEITGSDGNVYTGTTATFKESEITAWPAPNCPTLPAGVIASHWRIVETGGPDELVLVDEDADPEYADWAANYQDTCTQQTCFLDLVTTADGLSCFGKNDACDGWLNDPDRDTKYQCYYASEAVSVQTCYVYATLFNTANRLAGAAYADPATGEPIPGGGTTRSAEQELFDLSPRDVSEVRDCLGGTYGAFNPIEWIMRPVQCALEWAFVPRAAVPQALGAMLEAGWATKAPGQLVAVVQGWSFAPGVTGCSITVPYHLLDTTTDVTVLDACDEPMATVATWSRLIVSVGFTIFVFSLVRRYVGKTVDYT